MRVRVRLFVTRIAGWPFVLGAAGDFPVWPPACPNRESALISAHVCRGHTREGLASHFSHRLNRDDGGCPHSRAARRTGAVAGAEFAVGTDPCKPVPLFL